MMLKRVAVLGMLVAATMCWAQAEKGSAPVDFPVDSPPSDQIEKVDELAEPLVVNTGLSPRKPISKFGNRIVQRPDDASGRLIVKFTDDVKMRRGADGVLTSLAGRGVGHVDQLIKGFGLEIKPAIGLSPQKRVALETRAGQRSRKAQPDLGGLYYLTGPDAAIDMAVQALVPLDEIEFVEYEMNYYVDFPECDDCGGIRCGECLVCHDTVYCNDPICCDVVCAIDPYCCDEMSPALPGRPPAPQWDSLCVALADALCPGAAPPSICANPFNGGCFEVHDTIGCNVAACCTTVCGLDSFCCEVEWDATCVGLALDNCLAGDSAAVTPSFTDAQGYLTNRTYVGQFGSLPFNIVPAISMDACDPLLVAWGYDGEGWDLDGLWEFSNLVIGLGGGTQNNSRGKGVRVGVIEHSAFADFANPDRTHEELRGKVIAEPGQTIIINPTSPSPELRGHHGTACLGIIGAIDHGTKGHSIEAVGGLLPGGELAESDEIGIVGVAPQADLYFFPMISIEEGGRLLNAIANALDIFEPGDVLSFSIGPGGCGTLASSAANWMMMRMGSDLGVTTCISAGNDCCNLDGIAQEGGDGEDADIIIVGAGFPGYPHCRLGFSNYCGECEPPDVVHVQAWGTAVTTIGYGDLFNGDDPQNADGYLVRSYTNSFGGTSAACPLVAGLVANLQGFSKQFFGIPLMPAEIRGIVASGSFQCDIDPVDLLPGNGENAECIGSFDFEDEPARIGPFPQGVVNGEGLVSFSGFDFNSLIDDFIIVRGNHMFGNKFSIKGSDNNYLVISSEFTESKFTPDLPGPPSQLEYLATAETVDVVVTAISEEKTSPGMLVEVEVQAPGTTAFLIVEMFDWTVNEWSFAGFDVLLPGVDPDDPEGTADFQGDYAVGGATRFIHPNSKKVLIRLYTIGVGSESELGGEGAGTWIVRWDLVRLTLQSGFGGVLFPPPDSEGGGLQSE